MIEMYRENVFKVCGTYRFCDKLTDETFEGLCDCVCVNVSVPERFEFKVKQCHIVRFNTA